MNNPKSFSTAFRELFFDKWLIPLYIDKWLIPLYIIVLAIACWTAYQYIVNINLKKERETQDQQMNAIRGHQLDEPNKLLLPDDNSLGGENPKTDTGVKESSLHKPDNSDTQPVEDKTRQTHDNPRNVDVQIQDEVVRKSPHGYGNYPEIPDDFPSNIRIPWLLADGKYNENGHSSILELNARVLIKLWESGDTQLTGGDITEDLKVYPHYPNTAYVTYRDDVLEMDLYEK